MAVSIYHVECTVDGAWSRYGVCADGKTDAARIVQARVKRDGYQRFAHIDTLRVGPNDTGWDIGGTICYE